MYYETLKVIETISFYQSEGNIRLKIKINCMSNELQLLLCQYCVSIVSVLCLLCGSEPFLYPNMHDLLKFEGFVAKNSIKADSYKFESHGFLY